MFSTPSPSVSAWPFGFNMSKQELNFSKGVLLKGLPFDATEDEVKTFFKTITIPDESIRLIKFRDGKQTGVGFVKLKDEEMERALLMDKNHIGKRYVEVIASDETEMHHLILKARSGEMDAREINRIAGREQKKGVVRRDRSPVRKHLQTKFAYITGIPPHNQYKEVRQFFKGILIGMNCIHLMKMKECRDFRGDGYIEFKDSEECRKALLRDGKCLNGGVIRVEPCSQEEFEDALRSMSGGDRRRSPSPFRRGREGGDDDGYFTPAYREREGRYRNTIATMAYGGRGVIDHSRGHHDEPLDRVPLFRDNPMPPPDVYEGRTHMGSYGHTPPAMGSGYGHTEEKYPPLLSLGSGNSMGGTKPLMSLSQNTHERKIVRLEGLPYDTSLQDIVDFFRGYNVTIEHVRIQCRDDGSPSGKAFVTLPSEKFAQSAVQELNKRYIRGRYVELFLV